MVVVGEEHKLEGITIKIVEVIPYRSFSGRKEYLIGYTIKDRDFTTPTAHLWMSESENIVEKLRNVAKYYLQVKSLFKR